VGGGGGKRGEQRNKKERGGREKGKGKKKNGGLLLCLFFGEFFFRGEQAPSASPSPSPSDSWGGGKKKNGDNTCRAQKGDHPNPAVCPPADEGKGRRLLPRLIFVLRFRKGFRRGRGGGGDPPRPTGHFDGGRGPKTKTKHKSAVFWKARFHFSGRGVGSRRSANGAAEFDCIIQIFNKKKKRGEGLLPGRLPGRLGFSLRVFLGCGLFSEKTPIKGGPLFARGARFSLPVSKLYFIRFRINGGVFFGATPLLWGR